MRRAPNLTELGPGLMAACQALTRKPGKPREQATDPAQHC